MTNTKKTTKVVDQAAEASQTAAQTLSSAGSVASEVASAYVSGVSNIVKAFYGIGQDVAKGAVEHGKASMKANCVRSLAEMQIGYVQHRLEESSLHVKTISDVAAEGVKDVSKPLIGLLKDRTAA